MKALAPRSTRRTALAAILAGALIFAGQAGELLFGTPTDLVQFVWVLLSVGGVVALGVALLGMSDLIGGTKPGRVGVRLAVAGAVLLALFSIQVLVEVARTGGVPENFALFGLGFLLALVGQLLFAHDLRPRLGHAWVLPLVAAAGVLVGLAVEADPYHDIGLFVFEGAWVMLGVALRRLERSPEPPALSGAA